ncbi:MAG: hypothetical protein DHS20C14_04430 [Phycisphaeraceae bacterium]|nr:MAG: hypothetical protein DHS20C14_04430 [Phycisphaeraceae bacterium]
MPGLGGRNTTPYRDTVADPFTIRPLAPEDDLHALTRLLHRAYAPLAAAGMNYLASHQSTEVTRERACAEGVTCLIAVDAAGAPVGTVSIAGPPEPGDAPNGSPAWYARPEVAVFGQYAVDPAWQGRGVGSGLLDASIVAARGRGFRELACDTSEHAEALIALYTRRGFRPVGHADWDVTNYRSVVLSLALA